MSLPQMAKAYEEGLLVGVLLLEPAPEEWVLGWLQVLSQMLAPNLFGLTLFTQPA